MVMPWELSILDGKFASWIEAELNIIGNTSITGNLDVTGEITGGTIPIENLSNVKDQSFVNLVDNGDFKLWPAGDTGAPYGWTLHGAGITIEKNTVNNVIGENCVAVTYGSASCYLKARPDNPLRYQGRVMTFSAFVKADSASQARLQIADSVGNTYSDYHTGSGNIELLTVSRTINSSSTAMVGNMYIHSAGTVYFDGAMFVEGSICPAFSPKPISDPHTYGEMYIYNNSNATVIETANTPIAIRQISEGLNSGFIFHAGSTGAIIAYADYSGTVAGAVSVQTSLSHGLSSGDIITIRGSTNYNGIFEVTTINSDNFYIIDTWVANDGASDFDQGASLTVQPGADGVYTSTWQMTTAPAGACELCFKVNVNETPQNKSTACRDMAINDKDNNSSTCLLNIVEGDIIWLSVQSDATSDLTNSMGNMNLERM